LTSNITTTTGTSAASSSGSIATPSSGLASTPTAPTICVASAPSLLLLLLEALYSQQQHSSKTKHCAVINIVKYNISTQKESNFKNIASAMASLKVSLWI
jgi:hypothetical protein